MKRPIQIFAILSIFAICSFTSCSTGLESETLKEPAVETAETSSSIPYWIQELINAALEKARQEALRQAQEAAAQAAIDAALETMPKGLFNFPKP